MRPPTTTTQVGSLPNDQFVFGAARLGGLTPAPSVSAAAAKTGPSARGPLLTKYKEHEKAEQQNVAQHG